jgi:glycosyltransferase involved in cell wall biosynthesis
MGIRVAVIDDNPHVRWHGQVYPVNATFHRFLSAFLDLDGSPVASISHVVPLRELPDDAPHPGTLPLDPRLEVVATAPFDGIAGYLCRLPVITARNVGPLRRVIREADLVWIKVPASNGPLAAIIAAAIGRRRFGYVAGSARDVVRAQSRTGLARVAAGIVATAYDLLAMAASGKHNIVVGRDLSGEGVVTSLVQPDEIRAPSPAWPHEPGRLRLAWAGRLADGKGLETVLEAAALATSPIEILVLGDGPARDRVVARAAQLGVGDRVSWHGYVADRRTYLDILAGADIFAFPSPAEGFPKVVLDAMAVGLPVVGSPVGTMSELANTGAMEPVAAGDAAALERAIAALAAAPAWAAELRLAGAAFASAHVGALEAAKLVSHWRLWFPELRWL